MKFIDDFMEKKAQDTLKKENEQMVRKARLSELESKHREKKRMILHPVKTVNERKEMKNLKEEIAAYEKKKEDTKYMLVLGGIFVVCIAYLLLAGTFQKSANSTPSVDETAVAAASIEIEAESPVKESTVVPPVVESEEQSNSATSAENLAATETDISGEEDEPVYEEMTEPEEESLPVEETIEQGPLLSDLKIKKIESDYSHVSNDLVCLGNNEGATITIEIDKEGVEIEDLVIDYDMSLLNFDFEEPIQQDNNTIITAYVTANKECSTEFAVSTQYEIESMGDEAMEIPVGVRKLDSSEGKVVYITETGTKYHYSADCAGDSSIKTTYYDAAMLELEPCGKCVD